MADARLGHEEIATRLAKYIVDAGAAEQVQCLQLPKSLNSPSAPIAVCAMRGQASRVLALVDWWEVLVAAPPKLALHTRIFERQTFREYDLDEVGRWLAELSRAWWSEAAEQLALYDVLVTLLNFATSSLGATRGAFSQTISRGTPKNPTLAVTIGRARDKPQAATLLSMEASNDGVRIGELLLRTTHDFSAALPVLMKTLREGDDAQHRWLDGVKSLDALAADVRRAAPLKWESRVPWSIDLSVEPFITLSTPARVGDTVTIKLVAAARPRVEVAGLPVPLDVLSQVLAHETCLVRTHRLVEKSRYVVLKPFSAAPEAGAVITFSEVQDRHGVDAFVFSSGTLVIDDATSEQVLLKLHEHLALAVTTPQLERGRYRLQRALTDGDGQPRAAGTVVTIETLAQHRDGWTLQLTGGRTLRLTDEALWSPA